MPFVDRILGDLGHREQPSVQWHVAQLLAELDLTPSQRRRAVAWLQQRIATTDVDWIVASRGAGKERVTKCHLAPLLVDGEPLDGRLAVLLGGEGVAPRGLDAVAEDLGDQDDVGAGPGEGGAGSVPEYVRGELGVTADVEPGTVRLRLHGYPQAALCWTPGMPGNSVDPRGANRVSRQVVTTRRLVSCYNAGHEHDGLR